MSCPICGRQGVLTGHELGGQPGTHLIESSCHEGVWMDDDVYHEGWQPDVIYPPCPENPKCCKKCGGSGRNNDPQRKSDDCADCDGIGWKDGDAQWPTPAEQDDEALQSTGAA